MVNFSHIVKHICVFPIVYLFKFCSYSIYHFVISKTNKNKQFDIKMPIRHLHTTHAIALANRSTQATAAVGENSDRSKITHILAPPCNYSVIPWTHTWCFTNYYGIGFTIFAFVFVFVFPVLVLPVVFAIVIVFVNV